MAGWASLVGIFGLVTRFALAGYWNDWLSLGLCVLGLAAIGLAVRALWLPGGPAGLVLSAIGILLGLVDALWGGAGAMGLLEPSGR